MVKSNDSSLVVTQTDGNCSSGRDFCPNKVTINIFGMAIVLHRGGLVTVDRKVVKPPYNQTGKYTIYYKHSRLFKNDVCPISTFNTTIYFITRF